MPKKDMPEEVSLQKFVRMVEKNYLLELKKQVRGDIVLMERLAGIAKTTLYRKMKRYGIDIRDTCE